MRTLITVIVVILVAAVCSEVLLNYHSMQAEQQLPADHTAAILAEYRQVIALQPDSELAQKAQTRIEALEARAMAEDHRKKVFQEHGID